MDTYLSILIKL